MYLNLVYQYQDLKTLTIGKHLLRETKKLIDFIFLPVGFCSIFWGFVLDNKRKNIVCSSKRK